MNWLTHDFYITLLHVQKYTVIKLIFLYLGYEYESQNWDSEDIPATERDLAEDAPWKQIQVIHIDHA